ncbi:MAG: glycosyltransferase family 4 protein [Desulfobacula sp.]|uniref:glycosyltransferase family 4 protein n=1 Tax=Desulfobacula sp. TaxID=2593537 RepID=UPI0025BE884B|nr:glycosyltransferase family 4 protein [Desulfobacula sp.]MCD4722089.1 glycosyltransferase family 4 protein [Desulfobacula sp.]
MENMTEHEFVPFCLNFLKNKETQYKNYFLQPPGGSENIYFNQFEMSLYQKACYGMNMVYSFSAKNQIEKLLEQVKPDVALFLNAVYFTDSIIDACKKYKVPIIWRLSDFNKICANYLLFRDGKPCEECLEKGLWCILKNRCGGYQRSLSAAVIKTFNMYLSKIRSSNNYISFFITPSQFTRSKMIKGGFNQEKIVHIPTFISGGRKNFEYEPDRNSILYVGRISPEKGVNVIIEAFKRIKNSKAVLSIVGDKNTDYAQELIATIPDRLKNRINFLGFKNQKEVKQLFYKSLFFIVPSVWYENQPNVVLEGMSCGRPALVSRLGSLIEMVSEGETGYHFKSGNPEDLAEKIDILLDHPEKTIEMGKTANKHVTEHHDLQNHLDALNKLFYQVANKK